MTIIMQLTNLASPPLSRVWAPLLALLRTVTSDSPPPLHTSSLVSTTTVATTPPLIGSRAAAFAALLSPVATRTIVLRAPALTS